MHQYLLILTTKDQKRGEEHLHRHRLGVAWWSPAHIRYIRCELLQCWWGHHNNLDREWP